MWRVRNLDRSTCMEGSTCSPARTLYQCRRVGPCCRCLLIFGRENKEESEVSMLDVVN